MTQIKRAVWLTCQDSTDRPRLLEIAREHMQLVKEHLIPLPTINPPELNGH